MAYRRGDDTDEARTGALLEAESFDHVRLIAEFCVAFARGAGR